MFHKSYFSCIDLKYAFKTLIDTAWIESLYRLSSLKYDKVDRIMSPLH